jgi:CDP-glycerol glycerophosphotransferase (TagB/SpsB family)
MRLLAASLRAIRLVVRFLVDPCVFALISLFTARRPAKMLFASASGSSFSGNFLAVSQYLCDFHPEIQIATELRSSLSSKQTVAQKINLFRNLASAGTVVLDDYFPAIYSLPLSKKTPVIQLWHAPGAFKKFGLSRKGLPGGPRTGSRVHSGYSLAFASSAAVQPCIQEAFGMTSSQVLPLGVPKTDILFDKNRMASLNTKLRERLGVSAEHRLALFTPTFRGNGQMSAHHEVDYDMWGRLAAAVPGDGMTILIRSHPFVGQRMPDREIRHVLDVSHGFDIEDLLAAADILITDYSSTIFDFALLEKPMILYCTDTTEYEASRGFYFPLEDYVWGPIVHDEEALAQALQSNEIDLHALARVQDKFMAACDGHSTQRVVDAMLALAKA